MPATAVPLIDQIAAAMSTRNLRHEVIVSNIANRDTQGYQRLRLQFDRAMDQARRPTVAADTSGASVSLEQDLVALTSNSGKYQAMARVLSRYFSIIGVIAGNNRG